MKERKEGRSERKGGRERKKKKGMYCTQFDLKAMSVYFFFN